MKMNNQAIGVFDSGVGGVTVLKEIKKQLPNENLIYLGDTKSFPYGSKSKQSIIELTKKGIEFLIQKQVKMIVIACGTATSQALEEVKQLYTIPIIGVIIPTVEYIKENDWKKIGVIATKGTIRSRGWENALKMQIPQVEVKNKACPLLAPMAEEGWVDNEVAKYAIEEYLQDMTSIDALILGCTHFPLFEKVIQKKVGEKVKVLNTGKFVSKEVEETLKKENMENEENKTQTCEIYLTDTECNFIQVATALLEEKIEIKQV